MEANLDWEWAAAPPSTGSVHMASKADGMVESAIGIVIDRKLAAMFFANGEGFLPGADTFDRSDAREICYAAAIATELVLKAFLVTQGLSDDRCRQEVRHDLEKALAFAVDAGLQAAARLDGIVAALNVYYPKHAFDSFVVPAGYASFPAEARAIVADLFEHVRPQVEALGGR